MLQPPNNKNSTRKSSVPARESGGGRWIIWFMVVAWLVLIGLAYANRQSLHDWWQIRSYTPPADISRLAEQDTMTPYAKRMFYVNKPQLIPSVNSFRKSCPDSRDTVVLGCYRPPEQGIYIYDVKDPALGGIAQVTAAHEDLHAIYGRLSTQERNRVNGLLEDYYKNGLTDQQVKQEIDLYKKNEPHDVLDEMHSTFGTEVANLPPALESYYAKYFKDRSAIIAYQRQYNQVFVSRQQTVATDDARLAAMQAQINSQQSAIEAQLKQINAAKDRLDSLRSSGDAGAYNAAVPGYNAQVNSYNEAVTALKSLISQYNQLVVARNAVASELNTFDKELDTRVVQTAH